MTDTVPPPDPYWGDWGKPAPESQPAAADTEDESKAFAVSAMIGGGLIGLGAFLPWFTSITPYGTISHSGLDGGGGGIGDGVVTLALAIGIASTGIRWLAGAKNFGGSPRSQRIMVAIAAIVAGANGGWIMHGTWVNVNQYTQQYYPQASAYLGPGLYTIIIGAVVAFGGTSLGRGAANGPRSVAQPAGPRAKASKGEMWLAAGVGVLALAVIALVVTLIGK